MGYFRTERACFRDGLLVKMGFFPILLKLHLKRLAS